VNGYPGSRDARYLAANDGGRVLSLDATSGLLATAGAIGAGTVLVLSAQLLWCKLHDMKDSQNERSAFKPLAVLGSQ